MGGGRGRVGIEGLMECLFGIRSEGVVREEMVGREGQWCGGEGRE